MSDIVQWSKNSIQVVSYPLVKELSMYPAESVEEFKKRVKNGTQKRAKYHSYFAQLQPHNRACLSNGVRSEKAKKERLAILEKLL